MDMYRQPEKLHLAMEKLTPLNIEIGVTSATMSGNPIVMFPLHRGDDTFMSDEQYEEFYWPTFRKVIMGLVEEGVVPCLFAEGKYNNRLKTIKDLPKGSVVWHFDQTDMFQAKKILGEKCCIQGNVPSSLLYTGSPEDVKEYCHKLIEVCGKGGGFILSAGSVAENPKLENIRAMMEAVREYGVYKK